MSPIRNFFAAVGCLAVIVGIAVGAWLYGDEIREWWAGRDGMEATEPSPELAERAAEKLEAFMGEGGPDELRLSETELQSWARYRMELPAGVSDPQVDVRDSTVAMSVALNLVTLARQSEAAENLRRFFGDSARVNTELLPKVRSPGVGHITVLSLQAGVVPVPPLFIPNILAQTGFEVTGGRTVVVALPRDLREVEIEDEAVVLRRER